MNPLTQHQSSIITKIDWAAKRAFACICWFLGMKSIALAPVGGVHYSKEDGCCEGGACGCEEQQCGCEKEKDDDTDTPDIEQ